MSIMSIFLLHQLGIGWWRNNRQGVGVIWGPTARLQRGSTSQRDLAQLDHIRNTRLFIPAEGLV